MKTLRHKTEFHTWRQKINRLKENRTGGFTLVELIVVLVVLAILCTIGVMSIIGWQSHAGFKKQNQYAQNLFIAAQTQLTQYAERGQLTELMDEISDTGKADFSEYRLSSQGQLISSSGNVFHAGDDSLWQEFETGGTGANKGQIYYLKVKKGDYQKYPELKALSQEELKQRTMKERRIRILYDMLDPYIADKSMLDAAICLEFDPDPKVALVYSVFYNEKAKEFTYDSGENTGIVSIRDRREQSRREGSTGYYGAEVLSRGTDTYIARPVISNVSLDNGNSLSLTWSVNSEDALFGMIYYVKIYSVPDASNTEGELVATIMIGKVDQPKLTLVDGCVEGIYNRKNETDVGQKDKALKFPVVIDVFDQTITLVLDGLDVGVDEASLKEDFVESTSIRRLGLDRVEDLYASIGGSREGTYKLTAEKRSNIEHQFFGRLQKEDALSIQKYTIENARHLYNIRYYEQSNTLGKPVIYLLSSNIDWEATGREGWIYEKGKNLLPKPEEQVAHFKPILTFGPNSAFVSEDINQPYQIQNLKLDIADVPVPAGQLASDKIGLIVRNQGKLENLILDQITVTGNQIDDSGATGAFCGENLGSLINLTVNRGSITGGAYVGGIVGKIEGQGTYEKLTNRAEVTGRLYVGGITGSVIGTTGNIDVSQCVNYGKVRGKAEEQKKPYYIGGIAGYTQGKNEAEVKLYECSSFPAYTEEEIGELTGQIKQGKTEGLTGTYVGGIVGFNQGAVINGCNTLQQDADTPAYVVGKEFVGGIVGFHSDLTGFNSDNNRNQANVIGINYAGGITGCNARADLNQITHQPTIHERIEPLAITKSWMNEGGVLAIGSYGGGIAGCNYEALLNGSSNVSDRSDITERKELSSDSRYVGGIAGYNAGDIKSNHMVSILSVVAGSDFVGGIVGYNDVSGTIAGYEVQGEAVQGGAVQGKKFVGGFIGLNASNKVFDQDITCNLKEVSGQYFVGGAIGANLMPTSTNIATGFLTDHFVGKVTAEQGAFAGGFIGYNYLLVENTPSTSIEAVANTLCAMAPVTETDLAVASGQLLGNEAELQFSLLGFKNTASEMIIRGVKSAFNQTTPDGITAMVYAGGVVGYNQNSTKLRIQDIENITPVTATAYIEVQEEGIPESKRFSYAGGIIGKVAANVILDNCQNRDVSQVMTMGTYKGGLAEINYGLIQNCAVGDLGSEEDSYVGGLVGVNVAKADGKGLIDCKVSGTITGQNYVGGLVAENYGRIENPILTGCIIVATGQHVGGVAAYGYVGSTIILENNSEIGISISGSATNVGGIIGTNEGAVHGKDVINTKTEIVGFSNVGGFIGVQKKAVTLMKLENNASVQAEEGYAGGIVARVTRGAKGTKIEACENQGSIEVLSARSEGDDLEEAETDNQSAAGGITAINHGTITHCVNQASISVGGGYSGGIAGINHGTIAKSRVGQSGNDTIEITGGLLVGGITARNEKGEIENSGTIEYSSVQNMILRNERDGESGYMGGVSAENHGTIKNCVVGVEWNPEKNSEVNYEGWQKEAAVTVSKALSKTPNETGHPYTLLSASDSLPKYSGVVVLIANSSDTSLGGVAGINTGTIEGYHAEDKYAVVAAELRFVQYFMNDYGYLGGIAGINQGTISGYEFNGLIHGGSNNPRNNSTLYGYGGITGFNGDEKEVTAKASISDCKVGVARVQAIGATDNQAYVGGVSGINGADATITGIQFGNISELKTVTDFKPITTTVETTTYEGSVWVGADTYGYVGGVAGYNQGKISDINRWEKYVASREQSVDQGEHRLPEEVESTGVFVVNDMGSTGGIVGLHHGNGSVSQALTGSNWLIYAKKQGGDHGCGGIIGQWESAVGSLEQCENYGVVKATDAIAGGIIALFSQTLPGENVSIIDSQNHGDITTGAAECGGIVGGIDSKEKLNLSLLNVVNTGLITGSSDAAGLVASTNWASLKLSYSRNYGYSGNENENFAGLSVKAPTQMVTCFGLTDQRLTPNPIFLGDESSEGGYYFKNLEAKASGIPLIIVKNQAVDPEGIVRIRDLGNLSLEEILLPEYRYGLYQKLDPYIRLEQEVTNPEKLIIAPILLEQSTAPGQTYFMDTEDAKRAAKKLEARQTQVTWDYEIGRDFYIDGYDIHIRSAEKEDYELQLDVSQDDSGMFPELQEYMKPKGKILYEVAYDLDGNMIPSMEVASPSDAQHASNVASPSDSDKGQMQVQLNSTLKAELINTDGIITGIHFTLILPDVSFGCWEGAYEEEFQEVYPEGMHRTEAIMVIPWMGSSYEKEPEEEWFYLDKTLLEV